MNATEPDVIFVTGIMPRSGTHFLSNLICLHPDCDKSVIPEDGFIARGIALSNFTNRNYIRWTEEGGLPDIPVKKILMESLGDGLLAFLIRARNETLTLKMGVENSVFENKNIRFLIAKSPQVINIENFFNLFPHKKLIIIVRDGRALVESINLSFNYKREEAIAYWKAAANMISSFEKEWAHKKEQFLIVKYEDLYANTVMEMKKILSFLNLDVSKYDFDEALSLPVVGSSVFKRGEGEVHWNPVLKTKDFNPLERAAKWTRAQHERFNWIAKHELLYFGYSPIKFEGYSFYWKIRNLCCDFKVWMANTFVASVKLFIRLFNSFKRRISK